MMTYFQAAEMGKIGGQLRPRSSCASAQSHQFLCCSLTELLSTVKYKHVRQINLATLAALDQ